LLEDPEVACILGIGRFGRDLSDLATAIDLLSQSAPLDQILPVLARLIDRSVDATRSQIIYFEDGERLAFSAAQADPLPEAPQELVALALKTRKPQVCMDVHIESQAAGTGSFNAVIALPIEAPGSESIVACIVMWSEPAMGFITGPQRLIHPAIRLTALAVADHIAKATLRWDATHDGLTGLRNRRGLRFDFDSNQHPMAVLYVDLDDFKPINDEFGHEVGDQVLTEISSRMVKSVRSIDVVSRLGGDEFVVLCPEITEAAEAEDIAERLILAVSQPFATAGYSGSVEVSVGVALTDNDDTELATLLRLADAALYTAKSQGKHRVVVSSSLGPDGH